MTQGRVVPPFDINITHCGYCNRKLAWKQTKKGGTEESYRVEQKLLKLDFKYWPFLVWGPPRMEWSYGCPRYGNDIAGPNGWHYYWWEDNLFESIRKELTNAET